MSYLTTPAYKLVSNLIEGNFENRDREVPLRKWDDEQNYPWGPLPGENQKYLRVKNEKGF